VTSPPAPRPAHRVITVFDAEGYSALDHNQQRDLQARMKDIQGLAALDARLDPGQAIVQDTGDGDVTAWPPDVTGIDVLVDFVREYARELDRVNATHVPGDQLRVRLGISAGLSEPGRQGVLGQAVIQASLLANSDALRHALREASGHALVVMIDDALYQGIVRSGRRGLRAADYRRVQIKDKYGQSHDAWVTVPGRGQLPPEAGTPAAGGAGPAAPREDPERDAARGDRDHQEDRERPAVTFENRGNSIINGPQVGTVNGGATFNMGSQSPVRG
jgi:hypothetical protein